MILQFYLAMSTQAAQPACSSVQAVCQYQNNKNMSMAANKFASILSTAFLIGLSLIVLCLVFRVRTLYQDHQKLNRFEVYKNELQSIQSAQAS